MHWLDLIKAGCQSDAMTQGPVWRSRDLRMVFGALLFSHRGTGVYGVAFPWFTTLRTRNPLLIGLVAMVPQLPWVFFALPAEVWTDRVDCIALRVSCADADRVRRAIRPDAGASARPHRTRRVLARPSGRVEMAGRTGYGGGRGLCWGFSTSFMT